MTGMIAMTDDGDGDDDDGGGGSQMTFFPAST